MSPTYLHLNLSLRELVNYSEDFKTPKSMSQLVKLCHFCQWKCFPQVRFSGNLKLCHEIHKQIGDNPFLRQEVIKWVMLSFCFTLLQGAFCDSCQPYAWYIPVHVLGPENNTCLFYKNKTSPKKGNDRKDLFHIG